jgi:16S rRNA (guanine527-N7)-methyltransferase
VITQAMRDRLGAGLDFLSVDAPSGQIESLIAFLSLIQRWGKAYNLTAIRDMSKAIDLHLLDSLTVSPFLDGRRVLDVGTGAGLPGIPLAIVHPDKRFVLLDSSAKKIRFVRHAIMELGLVNVEAVASRVEDYRPSVGFDLVLARAFASLSDIRSMVAHLLGPGGRVLALKGRYPRDEVAAIQGGLDLRVHALAIPGLAVDRHLVEFGAG